MEITEVKVFPIQEEKLRAFVSIVIDRCFMVNDIKVIQGRDGLFISMPSRRKKNGDFKDIAHPLNNETRRMIEERILNEYEGAVGQPVQRRIHRVESEGAAAAAVEMPQAAAAARRTSPSARCARRITRSPTVPSYSVRMRSSIMRRVSLFNGWAMSLKSPFFLRREGMLMKRPSRPWMTLMSLTMKQRSMTIETNARSFSSWIGKTLTSVISMLPPLRGMTTRSTPRLPTSIAESSVERSLLVGLLEAHARERTGSKSIYSVS